MGYPTHRDWMGYPPPPIRQSSIARTCYAAGSRPLAFTQEDFLVCSKFSRKQREINRNWTAILIQYFSIKGERRRGNGTSLPMAKKLKVALKRDTSTVYYSLTRQTGRLTLCSLQSHVTQLRVASGQTLCLSAWSTTLPSIRQFSTQ